MINTNQLQEPKMLSFHHPLTVVIIAIFFISSIRGFPTGAPLSACSSLIPEHPSTSPSTAPFPYTINTDTTSYEPGGKVTLTLSTNTGTRIRGFIVQARLEGQDLPVGFFETTPSSAKHLTCPGGPAFNTVTHTSRDRKITVEVGWKAPLSLRGNIQFVVTIVESRTEYWTNRYSNVVTGVPTFFNCPETLQLPLERDQSFAIVDLDDALGGSAPPFDVIEGPLGSNPTQLDFSAALRQGVPVTVRIRGATDASQDCSFILRLTDNQSPNITCPGNQQLQTTSSDIAVFWPPAVARDNVGLRADNPLTYSHINGVRLPISPNPVIITVTAYDTSNNQATCDFRVLVEEQVDTNNPVMMGCPGDEIVTFPLDVGTMHSTIDLDIQGRDANGQTIPVYRTEGPTDVVLPGVVEFSERFREGVRFTFEAEDPSTGVISRCSFVVRLEDDESPVITCPGNVQERTTQDMTAVTWPPAVAFDNLVAPSNITISYRPAIGSNLESSNPPKVSVITAEARDSFNNVAQCQFIVALQKVEAKCLAFPDLPDASAMGLTTSSGQEQRYVSCDQGFLYAMTSNRFICDVGTNGASFWNPMPNDAMCAEPKIGERLSKSVTIRFIVPDTVCQIDHDELTLIVRNFIIPQLMSRSLCEFGTARACDDEFIVPYCGGKPGLKKRRRRQAAETLLDVDIEVSAVVDNDTAPSQVATIQQDVDTLVIMIESFVMTDTLRIRIEDLDRFSRMDWSVMSQDYIWKCLQGWKTTPAGCVPCPQGSFHDVDRNVCEFCPRNTYQERPQQTSCIACPADSTIDREGAYSAGGCYVATSPVPQGGSNFTGLTAIFVIFCIILCLALLFLIIVGIIYCCMRNKITHRFPSTRKRSSVSKLHYLNQAFESDNETVTGPEMRYDNNNSGTARRNVSRQFSRSSLSTQYGYSQGDPDELALMNSNFTFGVRDDDGGLVMRPVGETGRSEHGGPDGGESTSLPRPAEEGTSRPSPSNQDGSDVEKRDGKVLDKSTGEYMWPAPPTPPSSPPPLQQREGETVRDEDNSPITRL